MKKFWQLLNSPMVVAVVSIVLFFSVMHWGFRGLTDLFGTKANRQNQIEALGRLQLISFAEAPAVTNRAQKYVGQLRNNSEFIVNDIEGAVCSYDEGGNLIDVISQKLDGVGSLAPRQTREFFVERYNPYEGRQPDIRIEAAKSTIAFVDISVTETETK